MRKSLKGSRILEPRVCFLDRSRANAAYYKTILRSLFLSQSFIKYVVKDLLPVISLARIMRRMIIDFTEKIVTYMDGIITG